MSDPRLPYHAAQVHELRHQNFPWRALLHDYARVGRRDWCACVEDGYRASPMLCPREWCWW